MLIDFDYIDNTIFNLAFIYWLSTYFPAQNIIVKRLFFKFAFLHEMTAWPLFILECAKCIEIYSQQIPLNAFYTVLTVAVTNSQKDHCLQHFYSHKLKYWILCLAGFFIGGETLMCRLAPWKSIIYSLFKDGAFHNLLLCICSAHLEILGLPIVHTY